MNIELDVQYAVSDADDGEPPSSDLILTWVSAVLATRGEPSELTVRIVDEAEITELNRLYRDKDKPTNVLSFPFEKIDGLDLPLLGDVVICASVVAKEAQEQGKVEQDHWAHMIIHGVLHLLGYDHIDDVEADEMEALEIKVLAGLAIADPYFQS